MRKTALYSRSPRQVPPAAAPVPAPAPPAESRARGRWWRALAARRWPLALVATAAVCSLGAVLLYSALHPAPRALTQEDIDAAVLHTLETQSLPSQAAKAYEAVRESVVRVRGLGREEEKDGHMVEGIGTGVVIVDTGIILTNLHVVAGADRIEVRVLRRPRVGGHGDRRAARERPRGAAGRQNPGRPAGRDAALDRATCAPGDEVIAVGFPFGIGPSVSAGVVSGLKREYRSPEGKRMLTNLIQFDAAANPGNSGRPARHRRRRSGRHRHRHPQSDRASASSSASASPCRSRTPRPRSACRRSERIRKEAHSAWTTVTASRGDVDAADGAHPLRGEADRRRPGPFPRARAGRDARAGPPARRRRAGPGQDADREDARAHDPRHASSASSSRPTSCRPTWSARASTTRRPASSPRRSARCSRNLLLADEINRAPAKVQSALLEVMQEYQVTIAGETHRVPEPFLVMATQNPIETEGTYPLPEAQVDRFMMKVLVGYPERGGGVRHRRARDRRRAGRRRGGHDRRARRAAARMPHGLRRSVADAVRGAARRRDARPGRASASRTSRRYLTFGASPRATIHLIEGARALAFLRGRTYVLPEDVTDLAPDVLRHRLVLSYEALAEGGHAGRARHAHHAARAARRRSRSKPMSASTRQRERLTRSCAGSSGR